MHNSNPAIRFILIPFALLMIPGSQVFGQRFKTENVQWNYIEIYSYQNSVSYAVGTAAPDGDTVLLGKTFTKINAPHSISDFEAYRVDSMGRVYAYVARDTTEIMIYDFNLQPGDTFYLNSVYWYSPGPGARIVVDSVDTISVQRVPRRRLFLRSGNHNRFKWIEGIGGDGYPFDPFLNSGGADHGQALLCYFENGLDIYHGEGYPRVNNCDTAPPPISIEEAITPPEVRVWPNPANDKIKIALSGGQSLGWVEIYSSSGILERRVSVDADEFLVDISQLKQGLYFLSIRSEKGVVTKKLMVR